MKKLTIREVDALANKITKELNIGRVDRINAKNKVLESAFAKTEIGIHYYALKEYAKSKRNYTMPSVNNFTEVYTEKYIYASEIEAVITLAQLEAKDLKELINIVKKEIS
jgi:uncharacterized protein YlaN (UPF0358 family)